MSNLNSNRVYLGDCLQIMPQIADDSIDLILADLPYEVTNRQKWDVIIPFDELWRQYERIIKKNGAIVLTATEPFRSKLISSNCLLFKYDLIWVKNKVTGFLNAKKQPLRKHESILIFYKNPPTYNPQKTTNHKPVNSYRHKDGDRSLVYGKTSEFKGGGATDRYPTSILEFPVLNNDSPDRFHSAQKPIELMEYLIKTYTNENDLVLDNCMGSGTTCLAAKNLNRQFIGIEKEESFFKIAQQRLNLI